MERPFMDLMGLFPDETETPRRHWPFSYSIGYMSMDTPIDEPEFRNEIHSPFGRLVRGLCYRLAVLPIFAALVAVGLTYLRTHPAAVPPGADPQSANIYFEPISLQADDGVRLDAWFVPALDPQQIVAQGDQALQGHRPAVVLVHGFGQSRQQVLPLIKPLHERGYVVLALELRGAGSSIPVGQTFGLNEAQDVMAGVQLLSHRAAVDPNKIAVVGIGAGASAALLTAERQGKLAALVLDAPPETGKEVFDEHVVPKAEPLCWIAPLCRWTFEIGYGVNLYDLNLEQYARVIAARPTLLIRSQEDAENDLSTERVQQIVNFLAGPLDNVPVAANTAQANTGQQ
jgi:pimeloyl-ACP methyl ester carboxylesterase